MRILHTSDWHIGRTFHGNSTMDALAEVLGALTEQVHGLDAAGSPVDVVIVAGDVFDSATPAGAAYTLLSDTLVALNSAGVLPTGSLPCSASFAFNSAERSASIVALLMRSIISGGVLAGATSPFHSATS
jgi:exonuclease SbcD